MQLLTGGTISVPPVYYRVFLLIVKERRGIFLIRRNYRHLLRWHCSMKFHQN
jgi:hypothetical protein